MGQRRKLSAEYKREAVAMLDAPGVTMNQIAAELGIGATVLGRRGWHTSVPHPRHGTTAQARL
ncbi:MAG TPA: transposase [Nitrospiraceae bacterium]